MTEKKKLPRWEYTVWEIEEPHQTDDYTTLDDLGAEGWEAFAVSVRIKPISGAEIYVYHFKRPLLAARVRLT